MVRGKETKARWRCLLLVLAALCFGCSGLATYGKDRLLDLSDVVDVRYGYGFGLGARVQFTAAYGTGLGCSLEKYYREWFGRKSVEVRDGLFAHGLILGIDGPAGEGGDIFPARGHGSTRVYDVVGVNLALHAGMDGDSWGGSDEWFETPGGDPPLLDCFRFGGVVFLPLASGGACLNLGEFFDFVAGWGGLDPAGDDGVPKFRRQTDPP